MTCSSPTADVSSPSTYTAAPFRTEDGLQGCVVIFQDISERKRREAEHERDAATLACINRVEAALAEERFVLYAQPIVDLRSGRDGPAGAAAAHARTRWPDRRTGGVPARWPSSTR